VRLAAGRLELEGGDGEATLGEQAHTSATRTPSPSLTAENPVSGSAISVAATMTRRQPPRSTRSGRQHWYSPAAYLAAGQRRGCRSRLIAVTRPL
jgi:hypothetical protein